MPIAENTICNATSELTVVNCGICGGVYAIAERFRQECKEKGRVWTCPYCKTGWGYVENGYDRLRKLADRAEAKAITDGRF